jgi:galactose mutarotase-like enzyme
MGASTRTGEQDGIATATLASGELEATFATAAGMVCCSLRDRGTELLGQRRGLRTYAAAGSTMGIPFLHPWANRLSGARYEQGGRTVTLREGAPGVRLEEHGLPMHGLLGGSRDWRVQAMESTDEAARLVAELHFERAELLESFPFPHRLTYTATLHPAALRIQIALRATADTPVPVSFGFHPYLQLGGERSALELTLPVRTHLALDERGLPTGAAEPQAAEHAPLGERTFDDHYEVGEDPVAFTARDADRAVTVRFEHGYPHAQVFAPPGQPFLCFEPMTATVSALTHPGACPLVEAYDAAFAVEVGSTMGA